ncbi:hypothetical protein Poli38472_001472 [Pythium oligandrum]|uniref:3-oxo-5-alpha-steroid 4-dehydrogenase C-terminal domain-containing protein n=1 Tax=Pythium oligandrum TaxID=41045 RepID=A0A8K1FNE9_PYTOL|nr:hypothetical protein Poli38472_001472 [Pythium oligandrum]|eukprot:TMW69316.1 hypothetical protein Poli38472_001472 [Pythium oligandrum]
MWFYWLALWLVMSTLMVGTLFSDLLRALLVHGKVRSATTMRTGLLSTLQRIEMRKSGWIWFYLSGAIYNLGIAVALVAFPSHPLVQSCLRALQSHVAEPSSSKQLIVVRPEAALVIGLLGIQDTRRFLESILITEFGDAMMHIALLVAGLIHYLGIAPSVLSDPSTTAPVFVWTTRFSLQLALGLLVFLYGSYHQYLCNRLLAKQKRENGYRHVIPHGDWFDYVRCPLYTSEIVIYLGFVIISGGTHTMINVVFLWVVLNQSICALYGSQWYDLKFKGEKLVKWVLVPGLW